MEEKILWIILIIVVAILVSIIGWTLFGKRIKKIIGSGGTIVKNVVGGSVTCDNDEVKDVSGGKGLELAETLNFSKLNNNDKELLVNFPKKFKTCTDVNEYKKNLQDKFEKIVVGGKWTLENVEGDGKCRYYSIINATNLVCPNKFKGDNLTEKVKNVRQKIGNMTVEEFRTLLLILFTDEVSSAVLRSWTDPDERDPTLFQNDTVSDDDIVNYLNKIKDTESKFWGDTLILYLLSHFYHLIIVLQSAEYSIITIVPARNKDITPSIVFIKYEGLCHYQFYRPNISKMLSK